MTPHEPRPQNTDHDKLESALADLTRWEGRTPDLWRQALEAEAGPTTNPDEPTPRRSYRLLTIPRAPLAAAAMLLIAVIICIVLLPQVTSNRTPARQAREGPMTYWAQNALDDDLSILRHTHPLPSGTAASRDDRAEAQRAQRADGMAERNLRFGDAPPAGDAVLNAEAFALAQQVEPSEPAAASAEQTDRAEAPARSARARLSRAPAQQAPALSAPVRHIIRRATMELHAPDVRAAFAKAILIPSEARSEFVQASTLTGDGKQSRAEVTLRIAADRLDDALNELRTLGDVHAERTTGDDVTTQVVDLDARLRNERRIEAELLELLDKRPDSPLADVMQVRASLDQIRQRIEQLSAQQQNLQRSISLATILIIIRPGNTDDDPPPNGAIRDYFERTLAHSWHTGTRYLADSTGFLITILIGGLLWWAPAAAATGLIVQHRRRNIARGRL